MMIHQRSNSLLYELAGACAVNIHNRFQDQANNEFTSLCPVVKSIPLEKSTGLKMNKMFISANGSHGFINLSVRRFCIGWLVLLGGLVGLVSSC